MRTLFHFPLLPACRTVRLVLGEKRLPFDSVLENPWEGSEDFQRVSSFGIVPVLCEDNGLVISQAPPICEYLDEGYDGTTYIGRTLAQRVEVRRIADWFHTYFAERVSTVLVGEKVIKRMKGAGSASLDVLRSANESKHILMQYVNQLAEDRNWLAGNFLSLADFSAAAHLSCLDFLGDIDWKKYPALREWYARMKSRPCFRPLLTDRVPGVVPPIYYTDIDF